MWKALDAASREAKRAAREARKATAATQTQTSLDVRRVTADAPGLSFTPAASREIPKTKVPPYGGPARRK
jgi:hypothetical protein